MFSDMDKFGLVSNFYFVDNKGNEREVESPGRRIEMNDKGLWLALETKLDIVGPQI
jgi:hypothetical protein